ncbi:cell division protein FtsB [Peptoniphilus koenoeneniae]|uniref:Cell division protein FtsB n=1 Tax=Peptoniphilus koenoeneniae TaxID=507751 RepID=A0ABU0AS51_9FIRM|nr:MULTISPECIES: septum formation initiator family protein [Peptoniphilus]ERT56690.1 septum formation initiator [Peptoniphilus sp. BV3C26]MDQ0274096.1 cell division protein FtsB [Peptoniphilus koenoeneniae]
MKRKFPPLLMLILVLVILYGTYSVSNSLITRNRIKQQMSENDKKIKTLKDDISKIKEEIENSDSLEFIEKVAREEYGMVKPREVIYVDKEKENNMEDPIGVRDR